MKAKKTKEQIEAMKKELRAFVKEDIKKASEVLQYTVNNLYGLRDGSRPYSYEKILELYERLEKYREKKDE